MKLFMLNPVAEHKFKTRSFPTIIDLPSTKDYSTADGHLIAQYNAMPGFILCNVVEKIAYTNQNRRKARTSNWCMHSKTTDFATYNGPITFLRNSIAAPTMKTEDNYYPVWSQFSATTATDQAKIAIGGNFGATYLASQVQNIMDQNFDRMRPDLTEVSVPNFLLDWTQIGGLWKLWNSRRNLITNVANANLNLHYGWIPTVSDIGHMVGAIANLQSKLESWRKSLGKSIRRSVICTSESSGKSGTYSFNGSPIYWHGSVKREVRAFIRYRPLPLPELTALERMLRGYLDSLGFELNPAIIWDKIPFSFVLDWFLPIGSYLERLKLDTLELPIVLEDSYVQYKERFYADGQMTNIGIPNQYPVVPYPGASHEVKFFHRVPVTPSLSIGSNLGWRLPNRGQTGMGLSLILSNAWK